VIQAVIFDMDGVLIDSEPMWKEAEKQVFSSVGVSVTEALSAKTASMTTKEVTAFWYRLYPWSGKSLEQVEHEVVRHVEHLIVKQGRAMEGVKEILEFFHARDFKIGLATNSPARLISVVLNTLGISRYFHAVSSAEDEVKGKPDPAVYLSTASKLNVAPSACIAIEDSLTGIMAANKAKIKTVAVPSELAFEDKRFESSHIKLKRLSDFNDLHLKQIADIS